LIIVIQALVILFTGALDNMVRMMPVERAFRIKDGDGLMDFATLLQILDSTLRLATPCCWPALPGCFRNARASSTSGWKARCWRRPSCRPRWPPPRLGLAGAGGGVAASMLLSAVHGLASITFRGNQLISGVAINFLASG
jgi:general nucleoside transport system permease protein